MGTLDLPIDANFPTTEQAFSIRVPNGGGVAILAEANGINPESGLGGIGVRGNADGNGTGVFGEGQVGVVAVGTQFGLFAQGSPGPAGKFEGSVEVQNDLTVGGRILGNVGIEGQLTTGGNAEIQGSLTASGQNLLDKFATLENEIQSIRSTSGRTNFGVPVSPPIPGTRPTLKITPNINNDKHNFLIEMSSGFIDHIHIIVHESNPATSDSDFPVSGKSALLGLNEGRYTLVATDRTADPNDNTGLLWSTPADVTVP